MDPVSYRHILDVRGEEPMKEKHGEYKYIIAFRSDLLRNKVVWANNWKTDWHNYMKVKHSLYGVFKSPKCDPFTGKERAIVLFLGIGLAAIWSILIMSALSDSDYEDDDYHYESEESEFDDDGYTQSESKNTGAFSGLGIGLSLVGAVIKFAANATLKMLATCGPCQKGCCLIFRGLFECLGQCLMFVWSYIIFMLLITFIALAASQGILVDFLEMFAMTTIFSWFITDLIILSIKFWVKYGNEKKNKNGRLSRLAVDYIEYEIYVNERDPEYIAQIENNLIVPRKQRKKVPSSLYTGTEIMIESDSPKKSVHIPMENEEKTQNIAETHPEYEYKQSIKLKFQPEDGNEYFYIDRYICKQQTTIFISYIPMDSVSYRQILDARGEEPMKQKHGEYKYIIAFRSDILRDKLVWTNKWQTDWHNYMKVKHSLYGVFKAPRCDPFSGKERAIVLFLGVGLAAIWSMMMTSILAAKEYEDDNYQYDSQDPEFDDNGDMYGPDAYESEKHGHNGAFSALGISLSLVGAVIKFAANATLKMLATCGPCQKGCCLIFRGLFECLGRCLMCVWSIVIVILLSTFIALTAAQGTLVEFMEMFAMTTIFSWFITDVIILSIKFWVKYGKEKKNKNGRLSRLAVDYIEYEFYVNERDPEYIAEIENNLIFPRKLRKKVPSSLYTGTEIMIESDSPKKSVRIPMENEDKPQNVAETHPEFEFKESAKSAFQPEVFSQSKSSSAKQQAAYQNENEFVY